VLARASSNLAVSQLSSATWQRRSAYTERRTIPLVKEEAPFRNTYVSRTGQKYCSWISTRPEDKHDCAGEDTKNLTPRPTEIMVLRELMPCNMLLPSSG
jgi:hypothetical protein